MKLLSKKSILEAVAIAALTTICNKVIEHFYKKFSKEKEDDEKEDKDTGGSSSSV